MAYLTAAVVIVGVLCVLNLLLVYGVVRRLREHAELLSQRSLGTPDLIIGAGLTVGSFAATTVEGDVLAAVDLAPGTIVGFFSPGCGACVDALPRFAEVAATHPGGPDRVLAVVIGPEEKSREQVAALALVARVVAAERGHEIEAAFQVRGYPAFAVIGDGGLVAASGGVGALTAAAGAVT